MSVSPALLVRVHRGDQGNGSNEEAVSTGEGRASDEKLIHDWKSLRVDNAYLDFR